MEKGKYENDYYVIGGAGTRPCGPATGKAGRVYWVLWLESGSRSSGFADAAEARKWADEVVEVGNVRRAKLSRGRYDRVVWRAECNEGVFAPSEKFFSSRSKAVAIFAINYSGMLIFETLDQVTQVKNTADDKVVGWITRIIVH
jgi:hypothetical protein